MAIVLSPRTQDETTAQQSIAAMAIDATLKFGFGAVVSAYLIWRLTASLPAIESKLDHHIEATGFYLHQLCINTATSETQRSGCELK